MLGANPEDLLEVKHRTRFGLPEAPAGWLDNEDTVDALVNETLRRAIARFRTVLMGNRWRLDGGASLRCRLPRSMARFATLFGTVCAAKNAGAPSIPARRRATPLTRSARGAK